MTKIEQIKKLLETGFDLELYDEEDKDYAHLIKLNDEKFLMSDWVSDKEDYNFDNNDFKDLNEEHYPELNTKEITFKPIPRTYKEIKGKVDILDNEAIREMAKRDSWNYRYKEMIGQKGLEINYYCNNNLGQYYTIFKKNKERSYSFPAQFVIPHLEEEQEEIKEEPLTNEEVKKLRKLIK